jgi:hypothetical protein
MKKIHNSVVDKQNKKKHTRNKKNKKKHKFENYDDKYITKEIINELEDTIKDENKSDDIVNDKSDNNIVDDKSKNIVDIKNEFVVINNNDNCIELEDTKKIPHTEKIKFQLSLKENKKTILYRDDLDIEKQEELVKKEKKKKHVEWIEKMEREKVMCTNDSIIGSKIFVNEAFKKNESQKHKHQKTCEKIFKRMIDPSTIKTHISTLKLFHIASEEDDIDEEDDNMEKYE